MPNPHELPEGFELDQDPHALPPGFVKDEPGFWSHVAQFGSDVAHGKYPILYNPEIGGLRFKGDVPLQKSSLGMDNYATFAEGVRNEPGVTLGAASAVLPGGAAVKGIQKGITSPAGLETISAGLEHGAEYAPWWGKPILKGLSKATEYAGLRRGLAKDAAEEAAKLAKNVGNEAKAGVREGLGLEEPPVANPGPPNRPLPAGPYQGPSMGGPTAPQGPPQPPPGPTPSNASSLETDIGDLVRQSFREPPSAGLPRGNPTYNPSRPINPQTLREIGEAQAPPPRGFQGLTWPGEPTPATPQTQATQPWPSRGPYGNPTKLTPATPEEIARALKGEPPPPSRLATPKDEVPTVSGAPPSNPNLRPAGALDDLKSVLEALKRLD